MSAAKAWVLAGSLICASDAFAQSGLNSAELFLEAAGQKNFSLMNSMMTEVVVSQESEMPKADFLAKLSSCKFIKADRYDESDRNIAALWTCGAGSTQATKLLTDVSNTGHGIKVSILAELPANDNAAACHGTCNR